MWKGILALLAILFMISVVIRYKTFLITLVVLGIAAYIAIKYIKKKKSADAAKANPVKNVESSRETEPEAKTTKQKWNNKLHIYDTPLDGCVQKMYHGAGMTHYMDALMEIAEENSNYTCTKRELKQFLLVNQRVYQYNFHVNTIDLVPEPENKYDKNAVKIILNGHHVGYIRSDETEGIVDLFNSDRVKRLQVVVEGGKYKILLGPEAYYHDGEPLTSYNLVKDEAPLSIKIYFDIEQDKA